MTLLRRRRVLVGVAVLLVLGSLELAAFMACRFLSAKGIFHAPVRGDLARYLRIHDPVLGWPAPSRAAAEGRDQAGARRSQAFPDRSASVPALACYGDSFTWADGVGDAESWPERLAVQLGARVDNFGVGGYGSDQAFLRFRQLAGSGVDRAPVVLLVHLSENVARNLNQFRDLLYGGGEGLGFKPRFVLDARGALRLVPLPLPAPAQYDAFLRDPSTLLRHETFAPGSAEGPRVLRFPFLAALASAALHPRIHAVVQREPHYAHLYDPAHPGRGTQLTAAILDAFVREASAAGRRGVPVLLPTGLDLEQQRRTGRFSYAPLAHELRARGVPAIDLGPPLAKRLRNRALEGFFASGDPGRHFDAAGNALIAEVALEALRARGVLPATAR